MTCDDIQTRLFALPDPGRPPADLRPHLKTCPRCAAVLAAIAEVESAVARMPVPDGSAAKVEFLKRFTDPTVITLAPAPARKPSRFRWQHAAGLAAGVLVAIGGWFVNRPGPEVVRAGPRHDLLQKEVRHVVELTKAKSADERMVIWTKAAIDFQDEMETLYQVAPQYDLDALAGMFARVVDEGVIGQAEKLPPFLPPADRHAQLTDAAGRLGTVETKAKKLLKTARLDAKPFLERMARKAKDGKDRLDQLARG